MFNALTSNWFIFFPLACSLFVALRLAEGSADLGGRSFGISFLRLVIATLFTFAVLAIGLRGNPLGVVWLFLAGFFAFILFWKHRRLERSSLLLTALQADDEAKQFSVSESFWFENRGWLRRVSNALRRDLGQGKTWWQALEERGAARGVYERLAVRLAAVYGQPTPTSATLVEQRHLSERQGASRRFSREVPAASALPLTNQVNQQVPAFSNRSAAVQLFKRNGSGDLLKPLEIEAEVERLLGRLSIFAWVVVFLPLAMLAANIIFPSFQYLFSTFGRPLPSVMSTIVDVCYSATNFGWGAVLYVLPLGLAAIILLAAVVWFFPQLLTTWPLRWLCRDYHRTAGFTAFAYALEHEPDLLSACQATSRLIALPRESTTYALAAHYLQAGQTPREAFLHAHLINRREFQAFGSGFDQRDPRWSLQQLANWKMLRMLRRYWIFVQWVVVAITLILAAIVGTLAVAMFQMLAEIIFIAN